MTCAVASRLPSKCSRTAKKLRSGFDLIESTVCGCELCPRGCIAAALYVRNTEIHRTNANWGCHHPIRKSSRVHCSFSLYLPAFVLRADADCRSNGAKRAIERRFLPGLDAWRTL